MAEEETRIDRALFDLTSALQPVRRAWRQTAVEAIRDTDVTVSLAAVVLILFRIGPDVQQKVLAQEVGINAAALVRMLDKGEEAGLLTRTDSPCDRRSKSISLCPEGEVLARQIEEKLTRLRRELFGDLPAEEIEAATRTLRVLEGRCQEFLSGV